MTRAFFYAKLGVLVLFIGLPLYTYELLFGHQPERLVNWLDRRLSP